MAIPSGSATLPLLLARPAAWVVFHALALPSVHCQRSLNLRVSPQIGHLERHMQ